MAAGRLSGTAAPGGARGALRWLLAIGYMAAGVLHLVAPAPFLHIVPGWVAAPGAVV